MQDSPSVSRASKPLTSQLPCRGAGLPTSHVMEQFLGLFCPWLVPVISNLGVTSDPGLAPELLSGMVSSLHAPVPITRSTPGIDGHSGVAVTAVLATQCGVSSWLWSGGIRAGRGWLQNPAVQHPQRSISTFNLQMGWDAMGQDKTGQNGLLLPATSPLPGRTCLSSLQCPPHLPPKPQLPAPGC